MKRLKSGPLYYEFSRHHEPRLEVESGETIVVETEDAFSGTIRTNEDRRDKKKMPYSNPLTGPIVVRGAQTGDAVAVTIGAIRPTLGQCATRTAEPGILTQWLGTEVPHGTHLCPIKNGEIHWSDRLRIPYQPMLGCIGVAPHWGAPTTLPAGPHGGNLDLREVCPGSTVHLPVYISGGFVYIGDAHAMMGHGELSATGLEMPAETEITLQVVKNQNLVTPRVESAEMLMAIATGCPMERAVGEAYARLILWLESDFGWNRWRAYDILTHVGEVSVGYYGIGTVGAKIARRYAEQPS